jgi:hypothetical protein
MAEVDELAQAHRARFSDPEELFESLEKDSGE